MAREAAQSMADSLEQANIPEAVSRGRSALRAAEQARRLAGQQRDWFGDLSQLAGELDQSHGKLEHEQHWAEQQLEQMRKAAADQARPSIDRNAGEEDRFAQRTGELSRKGRTGDAPLPKSMLDLLEGAEKSMHDASRALRSSDLEHGTEQQKAAQRMLEMAREIQGSRDREEEAPRPETSESGSDQREIASGHVEIPRAQDFHGPEAFRKRVLEGLSSSRDPRLKDAVRRYAEGLLR